MTSSARSQSSRSTSSNRLVMQFLVLSLTLMRGVSSISLHRPSFVSENAGGVVIESEAENLETMAGSNQHHERISVSPIGHSHYTGAIDGHDDGHEYGVKNEYELEHFTYTTFNDEYEEETEKEKEKDDNHIDSYDYMFNYELGQVPVAFPRTEGQGWLTRWLSMGGEGNVVVHLNDSTPSHLLNITLPHRPAAFPAHIAYPLPLSGYIIPFSSLLAPDHSSLSDATHESNLDINFIPTPSSPNSNLACLPPLSPIGRPHPPPPPPSPSPGGDHGGGARKGTKIVLVERGGCDFATKVRAAQERGAGAVIVGDGVAKRGESDEEGRRRESLITMFSPEDTDSISIPSVFISRASYLLLRDLLANHTDSDQEDGTGLWVDLSQGSDETGALTSLLSFALLMPSIFLLATIAVHRIRVARQREADRAPPLIVLSLPERIWTPDIVWEKDDSASERSIELNENAINDDVRSSGDIATSLESDESGAVQTRTGSRSVPIGLDVERDTFGSSSTPKPGITAPFDHPPPPISSSEVRTPPPVVIAIPGSPETTDAHDQGNSHAIAVTDVSTDSEPVQNPIAARPTTQPAPHKHKQKRTKRRYFSKDECAICMDSFESGDVVRILPCGHVFHKEECDEWLMKWRKLCPTCRADVTLPPGGSIQGSTLTPVTHTSPGADHNTTHGTGNAPPALSTQSPNRLRLGSDADDADLDSALGQEQGTWASWLDANVNRPLRNARAKLFSRRLRLHQIGHGGHEGGEEGIEGGAGETTPLVYRSRSHSDHGSQV